MLCFNPYFRIGVDECLEHPYFKNVRVVDNEVSSKEEIYLNVEKEENLTIERLRELFLEEVKIF